MRIRCRCCLEEFPLTSEFFHNEKKSKTGLSNRCKPCTRAYYNSPEIRSKMSEARRKKTRAKRREAPTVSMRDQAEKAMGKEGLTKSEIKSWYNREYRLKNRNRINEKRRERKERNPGEPKKKRPLSDSDKKKVAEASRKRYAESPLIRLRVFVRNSLNKAIRGQRVPRRGRSHEYLGCTWEELKAHLESQFQPGMNWENRGPRGWHIDHREPLANVKTESDLRRICHFSNLQPMWWRDNIVKGSNF